VGVAAKFMWQSDFKLLANMRASMEAFYVAEAGIEWRKDEIRKISAIRRFFRAARKAFRRVTFRFPFSRPRQSRRWSPESSCARPAPWAAPRKSCKPK